MPRMPRGVPSGGWESVKQPCPVCGRRMRGCNLAQHLPVHEASAAERLAPSAEEQARIVELYRRRGATLASVSAEVYWSPATVTRVLRANGVPITKRGGRRPYLPADDVLRTLELYARGYTIRQVAEIVGRSEESIRRRLLRNGARIRPVGFVQGTRRNTPA